MPHDSEIAGKTVVIAGASSGFGRGSALAERGANLVVAARRIDVLDELVAEINGAGGRALAVQVDVSKPEDNARQSAQT